METGRESLFCYAETMFFASLFREMKPYSYIRKGYAGDHPKKGKKCKIYFSGRKNGR